MFKQIESKRVYNQIIEQIKDGILNGTFQKGMKLPSERTMSEQLNVSRASVREAIRSLEIMGLVQCKQGEGNYISSDVENGLVEQLKLMFMLNNGKFREINELRIALELEAVKLASHSISPESLKVLEELCHKMEITDDVEIQAECDKQFHYEIARSSNNFLIINILNAASTIIEENIKDFRKTILIHEESSETINNIHRRIYMSLKNGDEKESVRSMNEHMEKVVLYMTNHEDQ